MKVKGIFSTLTIALVPSMMVFILLSIRFDTPLIFDDYRYLHYTFNPEFSFKHIGHFIIRAPFYSAALFVLLKLDFLRSSFWFFMNFFFAVHVISVGLITAYVIKSTGVLIDFENKKNQWSIGIFVAALSLYPNFLELTSWPSSTPYFLGGIFLALGLFTTRWYLKLIFFFFSFGFYETFILPALALSLLPYFVNFNFPFFWKKLEIKGVMKEFGTFIGAILALFLLRFVLQKIYGDYVYEKELPSYNNFLRIYEYLTVLKFHSTRLETIIERIVIIGLIIFIGLKNFRTVIPLVIFMAIIGASSLHDLIVTYPALRVLYASFLIRCGFIAVLLLLLMKHYSNRVVPYILCLVLFCIYAPAYYRTFKMRTISARALDRKFAIVKNLQEHLDYQDHVVIEPHTTGMPAEDGVIDGNSRVVLAIFKNKIGYDKNLDFIFKGEDKEGKEFPRYYPCASLNKNTGLVILEPQALSGEVVYMRPGDPAGLIFFGPYISLDPGRYTVRLRVKGVGKKNDGIMGAFDISHEMGAKILFRKDFTSEDFSENPEYKNFEFSIDLPSRIENMEMRGFYQNGSLYFDHIRISKE